MEGDAGEVGDVDAGDAGEGAASGVFLEVDGGGYAQGEGG